VNKQALRTHINIFPSIPDPTMIKQQTWWNVAALWLLASSAAALTAYDCTLPGTTITALDLTDTAPCPSIVSDFHNVTKERVQLIQMHAEENWSTYQCQVQVSRMVTRCGYNSLTYGSHQVEWMTIQPISAAECKAAVISRSITFEDRTYSELEWGIIHTASYYSKGNVDHNGACKTEHFKRNGQSFEYSYETTSLAIKLAKVDARVNKDLDLIMIERHLRERFSKSTAFDSYMGTLVWDVEDNHECEEKLSQFYRGVADVHHRKTEEGDTSEHGTVVLIGAGQDTTTKASQHLGLVLGAEIRLCDRRCYEITSLESYALCFFDGEHPMLPEVKYRPGVVSAEQAALEVQVRSDFQLVVHLLNAEHSWAHAAQRFCDQERNIKNNLLALVAQDNGNALVHEPGFGPGTRVTPAGPSVAYVQKCVPVEVVYATVPNCTEEVPVQLQQEVLADVKRVEGQKEPRIYYMNAISGVLQTFPSVVTCSEEMPVRWRLQGLWFCSFPQKRACHRDPQQLKLHSAGGRITSDFSALLNSGGITSPEQKRQTLKFVYEQLGRNAVLLDLIRPPIVNQDPETGALGSWVSGLDLDGVSEKVLGLIHPWWILDFFGQYFTAITGLLTLGSIIITLTGALFRFGNDMTNNGWDGGRTLWMCCKGSCGLFTVPKQVLDTLLKKNRDELARLVQQAAASGTAKQEETGPPPGYPGKGAGGEGDHYRAAYAKGGEDTKSLLERENSGRVRFERSPSAPAGCQPNPAPRSQYENLMEAAHAINPGSTDTVEAEKRAEYGSEDQLRKRGD